MKFINLLALSALAPAVFAGAWADGGSTGLTGRSGYHAKPDPMQAPAYTVPKSAPYTAPYTAPVAPTKAAPTTSPYTPTAAPYTTPKQPKEEYKAPPKPADMCWTETKKCCFKEKADGYECMDDYATKQARCHPKIKYEKKCDKTDKDNKPDKPDKYVNYGRTEVVHYDQGYGPHVKGYPAGGSSESYGSKELPTKPYKIEGEPVADYKASAPAYKAPAPAPAYKEPVAADTGYKSAHPPATSPEQKY